MGSVVMLTGRKSFGQFVHMGLQIAVLMQPMGSLNCGMTVRRITDIIEEERESTASSVSVLGHTMKDVSRAGLAKAAWKSRNTYINDDEVARFRRVRIVDELQGKRRGPYPEGAAALEASLIGSGFDPGVVIENGIDLSHWREWRIGQFRPESSALHVRSAEEAYARGLPSQFTSSQIPWYSVLKGTSPRFADPTFWSCCGCGATNITPNLECPTCSHIRCPLDAALLFSLQETHEGSSTTGHYSGTEHLHEKMPTQVDEPSVL